MSFNHQAHRELWDWLSKHPGKLKSEWPGWDRNYGPYPDNGNECFACDACSDCSGCPLVWPHGHCYERVVYGETLHGLFKRWHALTMVSRASLQRGAIEQAKKSIPDLIQLARRIRDLPLAQPVKKPQPPCDEDNDDDDLYDLDDVAYDRRIDDALCGDE